MSKGARAACPDGRARRPVGLLFLAAAALVGSLLLVPGATAAAVTRSSGLVRTLHPTAAEVTLVAERRPAISGVRRFGRTLKADPGRWSRKPDRVRYQWLRGGAEIDGATGRRHEIRAADVGTRLSVRVTARKRGYGEGVAVSSRTARVGHRVPVRHRVTYHVETRGRVVADLGVFRRQAQATFEDPRGWRGSGVAFRRVPRGGDFTLVLSAPSRMRSFSPSCSPEWSCRVGRFVVINQLRWRKASPVWNAAGKSRRSYRHMVVNHETGHWLGLGHRGCPGRGKAPVMQQQSKGLDGCRPNPWPTAPERGVPRFG
jgi:hypothetical protein